MTNDEIRIAVAEACGWKVVACHLGRNIPPSLLAYERGSDETVIAKNLPDYPNDLNAMHKAERFFFCEFKPADYMKYDRLLDELADGYSWHATAAQRSEAFLRTLGLWTE